MFPPTPTRLPPATTTIELPSAYGLWDGAPYAIQIWHITGDLGTVIQIVLLLVVVVGGAYTVYRFLKDFTERDSNE